MSWRRRSVARRAQQVSGRREYVSGRSHDHAHGIRSRCVGGVSREMGRKSHWWEESAGRWEGEQVGRRS